MVKDDIEKFLRSVVEAANSEGKLPALGADDLGVEKSRIEGSDYSSTLAMRIARAVGAPPRQIAETIVRFAGPSPMLARVLVAGPGFINFVLADSWLASQVAEIVRAGPSFGHFPRREDRRIQVEFVSVNPTGPLTVGHGRSAVFGDVLARVLDVAGYNVHREYYVNDSGNQVRALGQSMFHHYAEALGVEVPFPMSGYKGDYVREWARDVAKGHGRRFLDTDE